MDSILTFPYTNNTIFIVKIGSFRIGELCLQYTLWTKMETFDSVLLITENTTLCQILHAI